MAAPSTLSLGTHEILLTVNDAAGNEATHAWTVTVVTTASEATELATDVQSVAADVREMVSGAPTVDGIAEARTQVAVIKAEVEDAYEHGLLTATEAQTLFASCDSVMRSLDKASSYLEVGNAKAAKNALRTASNQLNALSAKLELLSAG